VYRPPTVSFRYVFDAYDDAGNLVDPPNWRDLDENSRCAWSNLILHLLWEWLDHMIPTIGVRVRVETRNFENIVHSPRQSPPSRCDVTGCDSMEKGRCRVLERGKI
jgi:hypothetical protein